MDVGNGNVVGPERRRGDGFRNHLYNNISLFKKIMSHNTTRRRFIKFVGFSGLGIVLGRSAPAQEESAAGATQPLVDSPPVLQCPDANGMTIAWAVNALALGAVRFGTDRNKLDQVACGDRLGLKAMHERFLHVRLDGLKPNTRYYYRTKTTPFVFHHSHRLEAKEPVSGEIYSFVTPGAGRESGSFAVMNDTHGKQPTLKKLAEKLDAVNADYTVWNGDLVDAYNDAEMAVASVLRPGDAAFAAERPLLFVPGNHDYRGAWARNLELALPAWEHPALEDRRCARNFVVRTGPLALIGLDTGEDKPDRHPAWAGQARFEPYREEQRDWLARALKSPAVATAPFVVAFCHIPLFDSRPDANPGDQIEGFASWQRQSANLWGPLLKEHGVQLVVAAHVHRHRYDAPTEDRPWAQITGGGHDMTRQVTVIHGKTKGDELEVVVDNIADGRELGRWMFSKRKLG